MLELNKIYCWDCLEVIKTFQDNSIDAIVTDPPYELWFMGKSWDNTGIANNVELWKECLRVLKPWWHLLSFGGTRTYHRMTSAIEDAGFEVRDMIEWCYGSGFPKSLNIGKAVDKLQGNEREYIGENPNAIGRKENVWKFQPVENTSGGQPRKSELTKWTSEREWRWTSLKPAHEPICMARKPLSEKTVAENCLKWGTGGINIDGCRVKSNDWDEKTVMGKYTGNNENNDSVTNNFGVKEIKCTSPESTLLGRFPANLILSDSEEVRECFPDNIKGEIGRAGRKSGGNYEASSYKVGVVTETGFKDNGNASRFFKSIIYQSKASKKDRWQWNNHPTVKPVALMEYLIKMTTREWQIVLDPFSWSWTTAVACKNTWRNFIWIEMSQEYVDIAKKRIEEA